MGNRRITQLCERIREHCRQRQWYGPDHLDLDRRGWWDVNGVLHTTAITHDFHLGFEFPPATEDQLRTTEASLGFPIPPMLRALYARVANGGFGPSAGITGARSGYYYGDDGHYETIDQCVDDDSATHYFNLARYEQEHDDPTVIVLPPHVRPAHFLHLCYWGCATDSYIDASSGRVYFWEPGGIVTQPDGTSECCQHYLTRQEDFLESWLETWLAFKGPNLVPPQWFATDLDESAVHHWVADAD